MCIVPFSIAQRFPSVFQHSDLGLMYRFENENIKRTVEINKPHKAQHPVALAINLEDNAESEEEDEPIKIMPKPLSYLLFFKSLRSTATRHPRSEKLEMNNLQVPNTTPSMPSLQTYRYFMKQQPLFG